MKPVCSLLSIRKWYCRKTISFHSRTKRQLQTFSASLLTENSLVNDFIKKLCADHKFTHLLSFFDRGQLNNSKNKSMVLQLCNNLFSVHEDIKELQAFVNKKDEEFMDLRAIAEHDVKERYSALQSLLESLTDLIYPAVGDELNATTLEISAGAGGQEAMIWAKDLYHMYERVVPSLSLNFESLVYSDTDIGGARKAFARISGPGAYKMMRFEGGIHRVQRVPQTERLGRIHTSTAAVVVMPEPTEIQIVINPSDLTVTSFRSSGPGGQHVNRTDSAVRIVHNPSGLIVTCQEERSQHRNKELALSKLRSILYERQLDELLSRERANRRLQAGSRSRSEKIRTYNWPRRRVIDHRLSGSIPGTHDLDDAMIGGQTLVNIIQALHDTDREDRLTLMMQDFIAFENK